VAKDKNCRRSIIFRVNPFSLELYLTSRITLEELALLRQDEKYTLQEDNKIRRTYLKRQDGKVPEEIRNISFADKLYKDIPSGGTPKVEDLLDMLRKLDPAGDTRPNRKDSRN